MGANLYSVKGVACVQPAILAVRLEGAVALGTEVSHIITIAVREGLEGIDHGSRGPVDGGGTYDTIPHPGFL